MNYLSLLGTGCGQTNKKYRHIANASTLAAIKNFTMRPILSAIFLLMTTLLFAQSKPTMMSGNIDSLLCPNGYAAIGQPYLTFKLTDQNKVVDNESLHGKVVFINFWFEGCHPCMVEMEALNELFDMTKNYKNFVFISLTRDNQETLNRVREKFGLNFPVFSASDNECQRLNFGCGYPTSIILDKSGNVKYRHSGGSLKKDEAKEFVLTTLLTEIESLL
jgi:peroxiredoxin